MAAINILIQKCIDRINKLGTKVPPSMHIVVKELLIDLRDNYDITQKTQVYTIVKHKAIESEFAKIGSICDSKYNYEHNDMRQVYKKSEPEKAVASVEPFPKSYRLKGGIFDKPFDSGDNMWLLMLTMRKYHFALKYVELEIKERSKTQFVNTYKTKLPLSERLPFETKVFNGCSKLLYFSYKELIVKYHKALEYSEKVLTKIKKQ